MMWSLTVGLHMMPAISDLDSTKEEVQLLLG